MPTQYPYPETGWSTGKMAKVGPMRGGDPGREYRELEGQRKKRESQASENLKGNPLTPEEWQGYWGKNWNVIGEAGRIDHKKGGLEDGILIQQGHPQIQELEKEGWTTHDIPDMEEGAGTRWRKNFQFMRPPVDDKTPVAEMGGRVA